MIQINCSTVLSWPFYLRDELLVDGTDGRKRTPAHLALSMVKPFHTLYDKGTLLTEVASRFRKSSVDHLVL